MRRTLLLAAALAALVLGGAAAAQRGKGVGADETLPELGTQFAALPPGPGRTIAEDHCLRCHSADILSQQRLTEKQWTAVVGKMVNWGADVPEADKDALVAYLARNFGPDNDRFEPVLTRPVTSH